MPTQVDQQADAGDMGPNGSPKVSQEFHRLPPFRAGSQHPHARTVVERRCRVNVSGVVTPSPVGVAMLKLR